MTNKQKILDLLDRGMRGSEIARIVGVSTARVSQVRKQWKVQVEQEEEIDRYMEEIGTRRELCKLYQKGSIEQKLKIQDLIERRRAEEKEREKTRETNKTPQDFQRLIVKLSRWWVRAKFFSETEPLTFRPSEVKGWAAGKVAKKTNGEEKPRVRKWKRIRHTS